MGGKINADPHVFLDSHRSNFLYKDPGPTLLDHFPIIDVYQVGKSYGIERLFICL